MRLLQSSIFRALSAIVVGGLLIKYPDNTVNWITVVIGVVFVVSGIVSVLGYFNARRHAGEYKVYDSQGRLVNGAAPMFPIVGVGSILLGLLLSLMPSEFVAALTYLIGAVLLLGALNLLGALVALRRYASVSLLFWLLPTLVLVVGVYFMLRPLEPARNAMWAFGLLMVFYGLVEIINALKIYSCRRSLERNGESADGFAEAEEVTEE